MSADHEVKPFTPMTGVGKKTGTARTSQDGAEGEKLQTKTIEAGAARMNSRTAEDEGPVTGEDEEGGRYQSYDSPRGRRGFGTRGERGRSGFSRGEGRRGRGGPNRGGRPKAFSIGQFAKLEDTDVTLSLNNQLEQFEEFLSSDYMSPGETVETLKTVSRVIKNDLQREIVLKVLQVVCTSRFLDTHLTFLIQYLEEIRSEDEIIETVEFIKQLLSQICLKLPSYASKGYLLLTALNNTTNIVQKIERTKQGLAEDLQELFVDCQRQMKMRHSSGQRKKGREGFKRVHNEDEDIPPDDFAELPIFPSIHDIKWTEKHFLRANKEEGAFRDVNHYLDVQFRLLREDYIRPLRNGIKEYKELKEKGELLKRSHDLRLYHGVQIIGMVCKESLEHILRFDVTSLKRVRWQSSKRLIFGSLVCLSRDDFDTWFFAVVTNRDVEVLEEGIIQVRFESSLEEILDLSSSETFTMAETVTFFEAYRHVLEGLQEMKDSLPMSRYLVECNPTIKPPQYLLSSQTVGRMDLTALLHNDSDHDASAVTVINPQRWPPLEQTTLNASQMEAVQTALSKELAIIQGPPGTGKTYVGLKVAKILLQNRRIWTDPETDSRPILVVCYTNHALDQFLEGILDFCPKGIVRVGSRCKTPELEKFNLKAIRMQARVENKVSRLIRDNISDCEERQQYLRQKIQNVSPKLEAIVKYVVSVEVLKPFMLAGQFESFSHKSSNSAAFSGDMIEWLSNGVLKQVGEGEDLYAALEKEVTAKILQGKGTCNENVLDLRQILFLPAAARAQLYRFWLQKAKKSLQRLHISVRRGDDLRELMAWQGTAEREILPDVFLEQFIHRDVYFAITNPMMQHHQEQELFCIRAWLGVSDKTSHDVVSRIIQGSKTVLDENFVQPSEVNDLPVAKRIQLYRYWLGRTRALIRRKWKKRSPKEISTVLASAEKGILPDHVLKMAVKLPLMRAIRREMLQRHEQQSNYLIRSWLGIDRFCRSISDMEILQDRLEGDDEEDQKNKGAQLNVDEEADVIQSERHLDLDEEENPVESSSQSIDTAMEELGAQSILRAYGTESVDDCGFSVTARQRRQLKRKLTRLLSSAKPMTEEEAKGTSDLWSPELSIENRMSLYLFWLCRFQDSLKQSIKDTASMYNTTSQELCELKQQEDQAILSKARVIGMTTTGAARLRHVLAGVACPIIILEEAAEVLEAHVVTTLHKKCQHLILIGDHQQLRPSPTVYELCRHYKLDISLFERLVKNSLHHSALAVQHRMRPEVSRLVRHVYPELKDHETTLKRPRIRGVKQDVFLFHHEVEEKSNDETSSKSNQHEADLCVRLCRYLLQQDYPPDTITILTAYSGQVFTLKNIMMKDEKFFEGVRVTAVDNYQGEENDVIILSLVRSNQEGSVGFLGTDNRVCVALSRARDGFYAFGNFRILAESGSKLWKNICRTAKENGQLGDSLVLRCENHPNKEIKVTIAQDFDKAPEGGCTQPCGTRLDTCGHACDSICHGYDRDHVNYKCQKKCERPGCKFGHPCRRRCFEDCDPCQEMVEKKIPMCGHKATMSCGLDPHRWTCRDRCQGTLLCGHPCKGQCQECRKLGKHATPCTEEVERVWPCGHLVKSPCYISVGEWPCKRPCDVTLDCGHKCKGTCGGCWAGRVHITCQEKCDRVLPGCNHKCNLPCGTKCLPCKEECGTSCDHSSCKQPCGVPCLPCKEPCPWKKCPHQECDSLCYQSCLPCGKPCGKKLKCSAEDTKQPHVCSGLCGEKCFCFTCEKDNFVPSTIAGVMTEEESHNVRKHTKLIQLRCGHIYIVDVLDEFVWRKCKSLSPVRCPLMKCHTVILEGDSWRCDRLLRDRHGRIQKAKKELVTTTTISSGRRQKLLDSLSMLTHDAEKEKSFASKAAIGHVFKEDAAVDVNAAFALTNQIKLTRVFEMTTAALNDLSLLYRHQTDVVDGEFLKKLLYKPIGFLTAQRLRQLTAATRRYVYMTMLACAKECFASTQLTAKVQACLEPLKKETELQPDVFTDVENVLDDCRQNLGKIWKRLTNKIDVSILDAPPEQGLCDVGKVTTDEAEDNPAIRTRSTSPSKLPNFNNAPKTKPAATNENVQLVASSVSSVASGRTTAGKAKGSPLIRTRSPSPPKLQKSPSAPTTEPTAVKKNVKLAASSLSSAVSSVYRSGSDNLNNPEDTSTSCSTSRRQYSRQALCDMDLALPLSPHVSQVLQECGITRSPSSTSSDSDDDEEDFDEDYEAESDSTVEAAGGILSRARAMAEMLKSVAAPKAFT